MNLRHWAVFGCLMVALAGVAGCGLPVDATPQPIPSDEIPPALGATPTSTTPATTHHGEIPVPVYFIAPDGTQLVRETQYVLPKLTPQKVLTALSQGPTSTEFDQDIQSALPPNAQLLSGGVTNGVLEVYLDTTYESLPLDQAPLYFAQIVWTATYALPGVKSLVFYYNNATVAPLLGNGSIAPAYLVDACDYQQLAPPKTASSCPPNQ
jgi:hypothetical protein